MYSLQHDVVSGVPSENLLSTILEALAEPTVSYIGLGYDTTVSLSTGEWQDPQHRMWRQANSYQAVPQIILDTHMCDLVPFNLGITDWV